VPRLVVDPQVFQLPQARGERLLKPHKQVPGPELPAVRVARQLQVEAGLFGRHRTARLVRQQDANDIQRCASSK
jgi:hypothetical protein